ncbi:hypothetical protein OPV22_030499 [Ensete ventricosum]|uniref:HSF-type DNA-binding domain-containing protein n=1 Tax=Ensete ventricosum TaxID=4639 RepID=A0AAV8Q3Y9_ENSVE|nr:hypothetical protein OPV22_030499 [Ensete ventricosum]
MIKKAHCKPCSFEGLISDTPFIALQSAKKLSSLRIKPMPNMTLKSTDKCEKMTEFMPYFLSPQAFWRLCHTNSGFLTWKDIGESTEINWSKKTSDFKSSGCQL